MTETVNNRKNTTGLGKNISTFLMKQESSIVIMTVLYMIFVTCINPVFFSSSNLNNILRNTGYTLIGVIGTALVLITGGLDLSVGSVLALGGVATGLACKAEIAVPIAILIGLLTGALIGFINGFIIIKGKIPPLIATLGTQYAARGMVSVLTQGVPVYPLPNSFKAIDKIRLFATGSYKGLPIVVLTALVLTIIGHLLLTRTVLGRSIFAVGGNAEAARISGINIDRTKMTVYIISSSLAALTGIFYASRLGSAEASSGTGFEMTVICGAIIGGVSSFGGIGSIFGAAIGAFFMETLTNSLTLMRVSVYWQNIVVGVVLVLAVLLDQYRRDMIIRNSIKAKN